jgi:putative transposase
MQNYLPLFILLMLFFAIHILKRPKSTPQSHFFKAKSKQISQPPNAPKPQWIKSKILRLVAQNPTFGCRKIANEFNRNYAYLGFSVGKSFVASLIKINHYQILKLRSKLKHHIPKPIPKNQIWAIDITGIQVDSKIQNILGILDHGSRKSLFLNSIHTKNSLQILKILIASIEKFGKPKMLKSDNEAIFKSRLFTFGLWILNIKHIKSELGKPWQNGRIERLFGTLKPLIKQIQIDSVDHLKIALSQFNFWYNELRPHQHLGGCTPNEIWNNIDIHQNPPKKIQHFSYWNGLLSGYYIRR